MSGNKPNSSYDQCEVDDIQKRIDNGDIFDDDDFELDGRCMHTREYCEFLEEISPCDYWCNKYKSLMEDIDIQFGECKFTRKVNKSEG